MQSETKLKLALTLFGSFIGLIAGLIGWQILSAHRAGTTFASLNDLRSQMEVRDDRDVQADSSVSLRSIIQPNPSDEVIFELRPNLEVKFQGVPVRTNSFGMRSPEVPVEKPLGSFRVALLGDSFAFGWGVREEESFATLFGKNLKQYLPGSEPIEVLNFGVPGYSTFQEVSRFLSQDMKFAPDAVIVYFVDNDFGLPFFIDAGEGKDPLTTAVSFARRVWGGEDDEAKKKSDYLNKLIDPNRALRKLSKELKAQGIPLFLVMNPGKDIDKSISRLWILKKDKDIHLVTFSDEIASEIDAKQIDKSTLRLPNDPHPSVIKHEMIARYMALKIGPLLGKGRESR